MYESFFGLNDNPFSIAPDPRYLYMSDRHKEALAHLLYGLQREGGFVLLTGEVGTGKTTICRKFLQNVPENTEVAFVLYPKLTARELLATICDEIGVCYPPQSTIKMLVDLIYKHLLAAHAQGKHIALIIDEAQNLTSDVLEQLRLLTNLETDKKKLLQIILLGQPELTELLERRELRQLSQRVTARYHLGPLSLDDLNSYIAFRLSVAGCTRPLFNPSVIRKIHQASRGIPRLVNLICDRALLGAYSRNEPEIKKVVVNEAAKEVGAQSQPLPNQWWHHWSVKGIGSGIVAACLTLMLAYMVSPSREFRGFSEGMGAQANGRVERVQDDDEGSTSEKIAMLTEVEARLPDNTEPRLNEPAENKPRSPDIQRDATNSPYQPFERYKLQTANISKAYESLFRLWQLQPDKVLESEARNCKWAVVRGLECLHRQGNWRSLLQLNRPVILILMSSTGTRFRATLTDMTENDMATVELDGKEHKLPLSVLDQYWRGQYSLIWKVPPYKSRVIAPGAIQDKDEWFTRQFDLRDALLDEGSSGKGRNLNDRVKSFQQSVGIRPDGIPGTITIIMLNSWTQPDVPLLLAKDKS